MVVVFWDRAFAQMTTWRGFLGWVYETGGFFLTILAIRWLNRRYSIVVFPEPPKESVPVKLKSESGRVSPWIVPALFVASGILVRLFAILGDFVRRW